MDRYAVFVDAGYFFAAGAYALTSVSTQRHNISLVSPDATIEALSKAGAGLSSTTSLLRIYWYDAIRGPHPSMEQSALANVAGVKLRLGSLNQANEQKGVDSLIVTDIIELARNKAISDAVLVSGDEDLRIAVQLAQTFGVRVHILAVGNASHNVSPALRMEADSLTCLDADWIRHYFSINGGIYSSLNGKNSTLSAPPSSASLESSAEVVCAEVLDEAGPVAVDRLGRHFETSTNVPPEFDGKLIARTGKAVGRMLTSVEKRKVRGMLVQSVRKRVSKDFRLE